MKTYSKIVLVTCLIVLFGALGTASADIYPGPVNLTVSNTGAFPGPYATVTETLISGGVHFSVVTLDSFLMRDFYFNTDVAGISITNIAATEINPDFSYTADVSFNGNADGMGVYDIALEKQGLHNTTALSFDITTSGGLNDFYVLSGLPAGNGQGHYAAEIALAGNANTFFARDGAPPTKVPEPSTLLLLGAGLLGLGFFSRKKFIK